MISIVSPGDATDDEVAAVLAAVQCVLGDNDAPEVPTVSRAPWRESGRLVVQGIAPARLPTPTWGNIERLRRR